MNIMYITYIMHNTPAYTQNTDRLTIVYSCFTLHNDILIEQLILNKRIAIYLWGGISLYMYMSSLLSLYI